MRRLRIATAVAVGAVLLVVVPLAGAVPPGVSIDSTPANPTTATTATFGVQLTGRHRNLRLRSRRHGVACTSPQVVLRTLRRVAYVHRAGHERRLGDEHGVVHVDGRHDTTVGTDDLERPHRPHKRRHPRLRLQFVGDDELLLDRRTPHPAQAVTVPSPRARSARATHLLRHRRRRAREHERRRHPSLHRRHDTTVGTDDLERPHRPTNDATPPSASVRR